jgi:nitroimidazol reductase NimA-like FMN-containing flavoprotein (pyridoxamine 5'-phosphate oxidase superfamily)
MQTTHSPEIREMEPSDMRSVLARNAVGRLAFARGDDIDVLPVHYVFQDGMIYGRTAAGGKLDAMGRFGTRVAFQVDEIRSTDHWRSVLVHGTFRILSRDEEREAWMRALGLIRRMHSEALREDDQFGDRTEIFRIDVARTTGRARG